MPRKKTARKQGEKFVSKVSDKMVEARLEELHKDEEPWQAMLATNQLMRMKLLAYIRAAMELEEISHEIAVIRGKQGVEAALVSVGPRGGKTFSPLHRLRKTKMNQVLQKYRAISGVTEWIAQLKIYRESLSSGGIKHITPSRSKPTKGERSRGSRRAARKMPPTKTIHPQINIDEIGYGADEGPLFPSDLRVVLVAKKSPPLRLGAIYCGDTSLSSPPDPPGGKKKKPAPVSKQDLKKAIKKLQGRLRRKKLLKKLSPAMVLLLQMLFLALKEWEHDWEELLGLPEPSPDVWGVINHIAQLIEFANSFDKWFG